MLGCAGSQLGANLSKRVIKSNSRIASLGFGNNDRDTRWSSRRESAQLFQAEPFGFCYGRHALLHEHATRHRLNVQITAVSTFACGVSSVNSRLSVSGRWLFPSLPRYGSGPRPTANALISGKLPSLSSISELWFSKCILVRCDCANSTTASGVDI
jgi:hypothetical protein